MNPPLSFGQGEPESLKIAEFLAWRAGQRRASGEAVRRVASELFEIAAGEPMSDWHVAALARKHLDRFASAAQVQAIREIGDDMCRWQAMRQARRTTPTGASSANRSGAVPRLEVELDFEGELARRPSVPVERRSSPSQRPAGRASLHPAASPSLRPASNPSLRPGANSLRPPSPAGASPLPVAQSLRPPPLPGSASLPAALARKPERTGLRWLALLVVAALGVGGFFGVRWVLRDRARPVEGHFASAHLGVAMDLDEAWSHAYDRDANETKGEWQRRASVFFRGASPAYFDAELIVVSLAKKGDALVSDDEVRTIGAAETVGIAAADRECVSWRLQKSGSLCVSMMRQGSRTYNAREYTFRAGQRIVYLLSMYEVRRPKNSGDVDGIEKQNGQEITEANDIAESIEALPDKPAK